MSEEIADLYVNLRANASGFVSELRSADGATSGFDSTIRTAGATALGFLGADLIGSAGRAAAAVVSLGMDFQDSMNMLQAVSGATGEEMGKLSDLATELGSDMTLPATSAADAGEAMVELGKAGLSVNDTMGATKGVLQLSAAGAISNAQAATIAANALQSFGLAGSEAARVSDLLAAAANASSAEVTDVAMALQQSSAVAKMTGVSIEDLVTNIAQMANAGIKGSDAGTSLKTMMLSLAAPSEAASGALDALGVSIYAADGTMIPMRDRIELLSGKLSGMGVEAQNAALKTIFGTDAIRAASVVIGGGVASFDAMSEAVNKQGAASELAEARTRGLRGAIEGLKSQLETAALSGFQAIGDDLERATRGAGEAIPVIAAFAGEVAGHAGPALSAFGDLLGDGARLLGEVAEAGAPMVGMLTGIAGTGALAALQGIFGAASAVIGPLSRSEVAVDALAAALIALAATRAVSALAGIAAQAVLVTAGLGQMAAGATLAVTATGGLIAVLGRLVVPAGIGAVVMGAMAIADGFGRAKSQADELVTGVVGFGATSLNVDVLRESIANTEATLHASQSAWDEMGGSAKRGLVGMIELVTPLTNNTLDLKTQIEALSTSLEGQNQVLGNLQGNLAHAQMYLGLTNDEAIELASSLDVDLRGSVTSTTAAMTAGFRSQEAAALKAYTEIASGAGVSAANIEAAASLSVEALEDQTKAAGELKKGISDAFRSATSIVSAFASSSTVSGAEVNKFFADQVADARDWAKNLAELAKLGIDDGLLKELALAGPAAAPLIKGVLEAAQKGGVEAINQGVKDLATIEADVTKTILDATGPARTAGTGVGSAIGAGIAAGLRGSMGGIKTEVNTTIGNIMAEARRAAGIKSPSSVMAEEVGRPLAQGLVMGMRSEFGAVSATAADLVDLAVLRNAPASAVFARLDRGPGGVSGGSVTIAAGAVQIDARGASPASAGAIERAGRSVADRIRAAVQAG